MNFSPRCSGVPAMLRFEMVLFGGLICLWPLPGGAVGARYCASLLGTCGLDFGATRDRVCHRRRAAVADELNTLWAALTRSKSQQSVVGILRDLFRRVAAGRIIDERLDAAVSRPPCAHHFGGPWPTDFPASFPTALLTRNANLIGTDRSRILTVDLWGGYLNYKYYPHRRVFLDGRSDYYDRTVLDDFLALRAAGETGKICCRSMTSHSRSYLPIGH